LKQGEYPVSQRDVHQDIDTVLTGDGWPIFKNGYSALKRLLESKKSAEHKNQLLKHFSLELITTCNALPIAAGQNLENRFY